MIEAMTQAELVAMYAAHPRALEEQVAQVLAILKDDEMRIMHNVAVGHIARLIRTQEAQRVLLTNLARAILETATYERPPTSVNKT